jgi:hypothetical protein
MKYRISMTGVTLSNPYEFLKAVFPQWNGEDASSDGSCVYVTFSTPQTPADLGPLVRVELIS